MGAMRNLPANEITALHDGTYEGVHLLGYYAKGDTPAPVIYYLVPIALVQVLSTPNDCILCIIPECCIADGAMIYQYHT